MYKNAHDKNIPCRCVHASFSICSLCPKRTSFTLKWENGREQRKDSEKFSLFLRSWLNRTTYDSCTHIISNSKERSQCSRQSDSSAMEDDAPKLFGAKGKHTAANVNVWNYAWPFRYRRTGTCFQRTSSFFVHLFVGMQNSSSKTGNEENHEKKKLNYIFIRCCDDSSSR